MSNRTTNRTAVRTIMAHMKKVANWGEKVESELANALGVGMAYYTTRAEHGVKYAIVEPQGLIGSNTPDYWRVFKNMRDARIFAGSSLAKLVKKDTKRFLGYLEIEVPHSLIDHYGQDAAHAMVDSMGDDEIANMAGIDPDDPRAEEKLEKARDHLWQEEYDEVVENFEADPIGFLREQGWRVDSGKFPMTVDVDYYGTANNLLEKYGLDYWLDHYGKKSIKLQDGVAFGFDEREKKKV